ncbi:tetratricopeptide repeat protein [Kribbella sp. NPDC051952]|uniref:ATP-binding protein n=1 Tax=Kribbella sp. NPDC051952 TaxID=3154851 RepID=UPI0034394697
MGTTASLSELLRGFRIRAGLTQAALAEKAGLSEQAISVLERGTRSRPRIATVHSLTAALGLTADEAGQLLSVARSKSRPAKPPAPAAEPAGTTLPRPWQLPPTVPDFTGRAAQIDAILSVLRVPAGIPSAAAGVVAVTGMGGIGKTALAVQAAHTLTDSYPDGHLYLNLRAYGPGRPVTTTEALRQLIRSLGLDVHLIPDSNEEASAVLRSQLAGRRFLMLLDNAADVSHVLPLLPGSPGSAAIITSRGALAALPGARQIRLDVLSESESVELLTEVIGRDRVAAEPGAAQILASFTGRLPLAVRLIGGRLAARPTWPLQHLVAQLRDEEHRLDSLGSDETGVRASIASSVRFLASSDRDLDRQSAAALPLLSVPDGSDLLTVVAAHLLDLPPRRTDAILERLVDLNLLESVAPDRYRFHDLIRTYGRELAETSLTPVERDAVIERVLRFYIGFGWACQARTHESSPRLALATIHLEPMRATANSVSALRWFDDEQRNLMDRFHQASASSVGGTALLPELALALFGYNESRSRWLEMRDLSNGMVDLATKLDLPLMAAWLEHDKAIPDVESGDIEPATEHLALALERFRALSDVTGQARCLTSLSHVLERLGQTDKALAMSNEALILSRQLDDRSVEGVTYLSLGTLHNQLGEFAAADEAFERSLQLARQGRDRRSLAKRYLNAGISYVASGRHDRAIESLLASVEISGQLTDGNAQAESKEILAMAFASKAEFGAAEQHAVSALQLARAYNNTLREGRLLLQIAKISAATGDVPRAIDLLGEALIVIHNLSGKVEREATQVLEQLTRAEAYTYVPNLP